MKKPSERSDARAYANDPGPAPFGAVSNPSNAKLAALADTKGGR